MPLPRGRGGLGGTGVSEALYFAFLAHRMIHHLGIVVIIPGVRCRVRPSAPDVLGSDHRLLEMAVTHVAHRAHANDRLVPGRRHRENRTVAPGDHQKIPPDLDPPWSFRHG